LDEFMTRRPSLHIEVRVKAEDGASSLLNALSTTKSAAPSAMPDLIALSRPDLEAAAAKGLLYPLDGLTDLPEGPDWYPYARQMAHIQDAAFGLPFAGDALALVGFRYPLPSTWTDMPEETIFVFPAADPQALFTLSLYLSAGGTLQDSQGNTVLNEGVLANILSLYVPGTENDFISPQVINYENNQQVWDAFREQRGNLAVSWTSRFLSEETTELALAPLPGFETANYTLATGWSWALAGSAPENQPLAIELADFLSESQFLAEWSQAAGYLPTRPSALAPWEDARMQLILTQIAESAILIPSEDLLTSLGPIFNEAVFSVLSGEQLPAEAAQAAVEQSK
jgi:ABC-type glycerol-3-phosphate transport system substrate-binding protein